MFTVDIDHVSKIFGKLRANDDISLHLQGGSLYAIVGENGAGKSTLMKILSGYQPADSGQILINGTPTTFKTPADALNVGIGAVTCSVIVANAVAARNGGCPAIASNTMQARLY